MKYCIDCRFFDKWHNLCKRPINDIVLGPKAALNEPAKSERTSKNIGNVCGSKGLYWEELK